MKTRVMKKKFRRMLCASMAAIFVMSDMMPVAFAQGTAAETLPAPTDTERIIGFEMVNPLNSYEIKAGESLESLDAPEKIRVIVELPEDTKLSTFEEREAPEQTDDTLPAYEYSHTLEQLSMSSEEDTASSGEEAAPSGEDTASSGEEAAPSGEDTASSEDSSGTATSEDPSSAQEPSYTEEEIAGLYQESLTKKLGTVNVYALTDNAGASQYRVYGSIEAQAPQWYAIDENGVMLGAVEELDANWDFTGFDSTVAGEHQVKAQLPENYILSEGVEMACLQIVVTQEEEEQSSIENEDGSLPDSLPVSYIQALRATTASAATFPVILEKEGVTDTVSTTFSGGNITTDSVPELPNYVFIEQKEADGTVTSNGASLRVTTDGVVTSYNNVTAIYPVKQENGSTIWFYTTTLSDGKVAWQVPESTELVLRYKPDPNALDQFSTVTITSDKWWDGSASGNYEDGQQNYRQVIPVGETISVKVDLPTLYSNYEIIAKSGVSDLNTSETTVSTNSSYGHTGIKSAKDTVTFTFAVGSDDINIKLKFKSYADGRNFIAKLHQRYISNGKAYNAFPDWTGYKLIRMFESPGTVEFKHEAAGQGGNTSYKDSSGIWKSASKTAYQSYGPGTLDSSIKVPSWSESGAQGGAGKEQPGLHEDTSVATGGGYFPQVNLLTLASNHSRQPHKNVAQDGNGEATLFYVFENTMKISNPNVNGSPPDQCLQPLPVGVKVYTQLHRNGIFVPLDTEFSLEPRGKISNTISAEKNVDLATVNAGGMTIKIRRIYHDITPYNINQAGKTGNAHTWRYTVQVTGATGFLGMDFITFHDTQVQVGINEISNVKNLQVLHGKGGGDPSDGAEMEWETLSSGQNWYRYTFGNNKGGAFGNFYNGAWQYHYADREGGVPIRVEQKEGYGIPYLEFTDTNEKDVDRVGVTDLATNAAGYGKVQVTEINSNTGQKKPVQSRVHKITSGNTTKTVYEYLFGFKRSNNTWDEWGKFILFGVKADREQIAVKYDLNGGSISGNEPATSTTYVGDGFYVTVPKDYPTKGSNQHFIGWQIMDKSNQPLRDTNNKIIYLRPNQTIATTDTGYFPQEKLPLENGEAYTDSGGKGYYNTTVVNLKAAYSSTVTEGQMVEGTVTYYVQNDVAVNTGDTDLSQEYTPFQSEKSIVPYQQGYYVVNNVGDTHPENGTTYIYNDPLSVYSGIAEYDNGGSTVTLASFRYDKGISVIYNALTDGAPDGVSNPSDDKLYTTVKDHENTITLKQPEGLTSTDRFKGWQAGDDTANLIPSSVTDLILDGTAKDNLTLSPDENPTKATIGGSLAEEIFTAGTVKLYAVYENIKITYDDQGKMKPDEPQKIKAYQESDGKYSVTASFHMASDVSADSTAYYAVYATQTGTTFWGLTEMGTIDLSKKTAQRQNNNDKLYYPRFADANLAIEVTGSGGSPNPQTSITLKFSGIKTLGPSQVTYRIYMWNGSNGTNTLDQAAKSMTVNGSNSIDSVFPDTNYPYNAMIYRSIPEVYTQSTDTTVNTPKNKMFYEEDTFTITGTFTLETLTNNNGEKINQLLTDADLAGELQVALYKKNPGRGQEYQWWASAKPDGNGGLTVEKNGSVGTVTINKVGNSEKDFTVTISKINVTDQWDSNAEYRIYAWTGDNSRSLPSGFGQRDNTMDESAANAINSTTGIPSVTTTMMCLTNDSVITYPRQVIMMDNVVSGDKKIYSGNEKVTLTPVSEAEIPNPDTGMDVKIQGIDTAPNNSFNITNAGKNIAIQCFAGTIDGSGTSASPVTGTIGNIKCPTGGASSSSLPFYFRSLNAPNAVDGEVYSGTIQFVFSHTASTN